MLHASLAEQAKQASTDLTESRKKLTRIIDAAQVVLAQELCDEGLENAEIAIQVWPHAAGFANCTTSLKRQAKQIVAHSKLGSACPGRPA